MNIGLHYTDLSRFVKTRVRSLIWLALIAWQTRAMAPFDLPYTHKRGRIYTSPEEVQDADQCGNR
jgi:hypothetical protein